MRQHYLFEDFFDENPDNIESDILDDDSSEDFDKSSYLYVLTIEREDADDLITKRMPFYFKTLFEIYDSLFDYQVRLEDNRCSVYYNLNENVPAMGLYNFCKKLFSLFSVTIAGNLNKDTYLINVNQKTHSEMSLSPVRFIKNYTQEPFIATFFEFYGLIEEYLELFDEKKLRISVNKEWIPDFLIKYIGANRKYTGDIYKDSDDIVIFLPFYEFLYTGSKSFTIYAHLSEPSYMNEITLKKYNDSKEKKSFIKRKLTKCKKSDKSNWKVITINNDAYRLDNQHWYFNANLDSYIGEESKKIVGWLFSYSRID